MFALICLFSDAIRASWLRNIKSIVDELEMCYLTRSGRDTAKFLLADPLYWFNEQSEKSPDDSKLLESIYQESDMYQDMLFLEKIPEGYQRLGISFDASFALICG